MLTPRPYQQKSIDHLLSRLRAGERGLVDASDMGCHAAGTQILLYDGTLRPVEKISVGDVVMGWDSTPRHVLGTSRGTEEMVRICPVKGDPFEVNLSHVLTLVQTNTHPSRKEFLTNGTVIDVKVSEWLRWTTAKKNLFKLFRAPVDCWPEREFRIDPYHLGVLLGDGCMTIKCHLSISKPGEVMAGVVKELADSFGCVVSTRGSDSNPSHYLTNNAELWGELQSLGLAGTDSGTKFVPQSYKVGSRRQRLLLLAGLMDTDGHLSSGSFDYCSKSEQLARDVAFVARSVGLAAYVNPVKRGCQNGFVGDYFRVCISGDVSQIPCRQPNRIAAPRRQIKSTLRTGFSVVRLPPGEFFGFSLTGDGRFLMGDFTVTHNTGKTPVASIILRELNLPSLVVCPRAVIPGWTRTAGLVGTEFDVMNYEMVRTGRTPYGSWERLPGHLQPRFVWNRAIKFLVFDEVHRCQSSDKTLRLGPKAIKVLRVAQNADMLRAARRQGIPCLGLSATMADDPLDLNALGYVLGLHDGDEKETLRRPNPLRFYQWARKHGCGAGAFGSVVFRGAEDQKLQHMEKIHRAIFPDKGVRVRIADLPDFPKCNIFAELYDLEEAGEIDRAYAEMATALSKLEERSVDDKPGVLVDIIRERERVELLKVPTFVEQAQEDLAAGRSVAIFVNFKSVIDELCKRLETDCFVDGRQVGEKGNRQREQNRLRFQHDESRVIVCNGDAGGIGLDLHDIHSKFPRTGIVSCGYNAKVVRQILGRLPRDGAKWPSIYRFVFAAGTIEERVHRSVSGKLDRMDTLNDADLDPINLPIG